MDVAFSLEKAHFLLTKGLENVCSIQLPADQELMARRLAIEKQPKDPNLDYELFDIIRTLNHFNVFKETIAAKISILLSTNTASLIFGNRYEISARVLQKIIGRYEMTKSGIYETGGGRFFDGTKLEIYINLNRKNGNSFQLVCAIFVSNEELVDIIGKNPFRLNKSSFLQSLRIPGSYYVSDLLSAEMVTEKLLPKFISEVYRYKKALTVEDWAYNESRIHDLSNYYIGLG